MAEKTDNTVKVNVEIAGRKYSFTITPEDEELVRKACNTLNARMQDLSRLKFNDSFDHLATAALQCLVWFFREKKRDVSGNLIREIQFLDSQIDDYIKNDVK